MFNNLVRLQTSPVERLWRKATFAQLLCQFNDIDRFERMPICDCVRCKLLWVCNVRPIATVSLSLSRYSVSSSRT